MGNGKSKQLNTATNHKQILLLAIAAAMAAVSPLRAATDNWTGGAGDGKFGTAANWSAGTVPTASDVAEFNIGVASVYTVTLSAASYSSQLIVDNNSLTLTNGGYAYTLGSNGALGTGGESLIVGNGATDSAATLNLGVSGGFGTVWGVNAAIGETGGSVGTIVLGSAGGYSAARLLSLSGTLAVGYGGQGTLTINSGTADISGDLDIAALSGSIGKVDIELTSAGACSYGYGTMPLQIGGNLYVGGSATGSGGTGTLLINGTSGGAYSEGNSYGVQVKGTATIYSGATVTLQSGLLEAASISNSGTLNFTGGTLHLTNSDLAIGSSGLLGATVTLGAGKTLDISGSTHVTSGGTLAISGGEMDTGSLSSSGSISFTGGTLSITHSDLIIDSGGPLGNNVAVSSGQKLDVAGNNLVVGNTGAGNVAVGSGGYVDANQLFIGAQAGSNGVVTVDGILSGGSVFVGGNAAGAGGTGSLTLNSGANIYSSTITIWQHGTVTDGAGNLYNTININPGGVMDTTGSDSLEAQFVTNAGLIEVQNGTLALTGSKSLANTGGTIQADTGTSLQLAAATVSGGTLTSAGTGMFVSTAATLDGTPTGGLTNSAVVNVNDSGSSSAADSLTIQGNIVNNGQINIASTGDDTWLYINGAVNISGTGTVTLTDNGGNTAFLAGSPSGSNDSLANAGTIQGSGTIGDSSATNFDLQSITNSGIIDADVSGKTLVLGLPYNAFSNTGTLEAANGGLLAFNKGAIINNAGGTILASGGNSIVELNNADVQGGSINQTGGGNIQFFSSGTYQNATFDGSVNELILGLNITVPTSNTLTLAGKVQNNGNLTVQGPSGGYIGATLYFKGNTTLSGTGGVILSSGSYFDGYNSSSTLNNTITISGVGYMNTGSLNNSGTISANVTGKTLNIGISGITNFGTMESTNGSTMEFSDNTVANTGGTILADGAGSVTYLAGAIIQGGSVSATAGGVVDLDGGTVQGGTLTTDAQSTIYAGSGILDGSSSPVTNAADLQATNSGSYGGSLTLKGTIDNTGNITIHSSEMLNISGSVTLDGNGILQLNNNTGAPAIMQGSNYHGSDSLLNNSTIQGAGTIGDPNGSYPVALTNAGIIDANANGKILNIYGTVTNTGTLEATNGGTLFLHAAYTQTTGTTYFGSVGGGGVEFGGGFTMTGGNSYGSGGSFSGDFYNSGGNFYPGNPYTGGGFSAETGTFIISQNYTGGSGSSANFHIGGTGQGLSNGYDYLDVGGTFTAAGQLAVEFVNNFQSSITSADTFDIIHAVGGITGSFSNAVSGGTVETTDGFGSFHVSYGSGSASANDVVLSDFSFTPGGGGNAANAKQGTASGNGGEIFNNVYSNSWIDPAGKTLVYTMTSGSLFTRIDAFAPGYDGLTITVNGHTYTGFGAGSGYINTFDFTSLPGGGATSFSIGNIATNLSNPFAVQLGFNTPTASFSVAPQAVPEPDAAALLELGSLAIFLLPRRHHGAGTGSGRVSKP